MIRPTMSLLPGDPAGPPRPGLAAARRGQRPAPALLRPRARGPVRLGVLRARRADDRGRRAAAAHPCVSGCGRRRPTRPRWSRRSRPAASCAARGCPRTAARPVVALTLAGRELVERAVPRAHRARRPGLRGARRRREALPGRGLPQARGLASRTTASRIGLRMAVDPQQSFPDLEQAVLERWRERDVFHESLRRRQGAEPWVFYEGPPTANGPPGGPPRPVARLQGHLPALQDDARAPRRAQGRLGLPRPAGRDRRREAARHQEQGGDRGVRHRRVQPALPRVGLRVPRGLERADRAHRLLGRPRRRLPHAGRRLHRVGLVGAASRSRTRDLLYEGHKVVPYCPRCGTALSSPRGRARLQATSSTRASTSASRSPRTAARCRPATSCSCGRRRRGRWSPTPRSPSTPS